ncbi:ABC-three component system middle component 2 [Paenibacillus sp. FSL R7-0048]|uniref:ABC-three component system middle component 2 n=1 Tax=Paenibacillus TaxID=44249 RepID=UPI00096E5BC8|nr:ABC-three component system middle component 2 [Paenibacillus odorifer]OMD64115.1 hypothetical protein BSK48_25285 [Paenibacillus odorifer]
MNKASEVNSELILNVTRILVLLSNFNNQKTIKTTLDKIMLFDFYMKYPRVMIDDEKSEEKISYYDYYSYYHWKPDRAEYHMYLRYLMAKRLITRNIASNEFVYIISNKGIEITESLKSTHSNDLKSVAMYVKKYVSKLSDTKIEEDIIYKSMSRLKR